jgi:hypothetical protein
LSLLYLAVWAIHRWVDPKFEKLHTDLTNLANKHDWFDKVVTTRINEAMANERAARDQAVRALTQRLEEFMKQFPEGMST